MRSPDIMESALDSPDSAVANGGGKYSNWPDQWPQRREGDVFALHEGMLVPSPFKAA